MKGEDGKVAVENVSSEEQEEQFKQPKKNDSIEYSNKDDDTWIRAIKTSKIRKHKDWYIFLFQR